MPDLAELPAVLTVEETAKLLRIGRSAAYAAAKAGQLPCIRVGRSLRVPRSRLAELLGEDPTNATTPLQTGPAPKERDAGAQPSV